MAVPHSQRQTPLSATISTADGIRFVAAAYSPDDLIAQIAGYIQTRCAHALWPEDGTKVQRLLDSGRPYAAIALYFDRVGDRWDHERLDIQGLVSDDPISVSRPHPDDADRTTGSTMAGAI